MCRPSRPSPSVLPGPPGGPRPLAHLPAQEPPPHGAQGPSFKPVPFYITVLSVMLRGQPRKTPWSPASVRGLLLLSSYPPHHRQAPKSWRTELLSGPAEALWPPAQPMTPAPRDNLFTTWSVPKE